MERLRRRSWPSQGEPHRWALLDTSVASTDARMLGGSNMGNGAGVSTEPINSHNRDQSILVTLRPLAVVVFKLQKS